MNNKHCFQKWESNIGYLLMYLCLVLYSVYELTWIDRSLVTIIGYSLSYHYPNNITTAPPYMHKPSLALASHRSRRRIPAPSLDTLKLYAHLTAPFSRSLFMQPCLHDSNPFSFSLPVPPTTLFITLSFITCMQRIQYQWSLDVLVKLRVVLCYFNLCDE